MNPVDLLPRGRTSRLRILDSIDYTRKASASAAAAAAAAAPPTPKVSVSLDVISRRLCQPPRRVLDMVVVPAGLQNAKSTSIVPRLLVGGRGGAARSAAALDFSRALQRRNPCELTPIARRLAPCVLVDSCGLEMDEGGGALRRNCARHLLRSSKGPKNAKSTSNAPRSAPVPLADSLDTSS
ncbi:hypothetical protein K523DRAFT_422388 [Schizophyllum commune Tattone D]|nr:hypothetical protein K523DRAFT_422388 [Schizophyllum commune Tattone D]